MKKFVVIGIYLASIVAANFAVETWGVIPIGFGLLAPAGVFVIGITLALRDEVHELVGVKGSAIAVLVGAGISALFSPALAFASAAAFLVSESLDLAVYAPLRESGKTRALLASNAVGLVVDSIVFLSLAFGSLEFLPGQIVGKVYATLAAALFVWLRERHRAQSDYWQQRWMNEKITKSDWVNDPDPLENVPSWVQSEADYERYKRER